MGDSENPLQFSLKTAFAAMLVASGLLYFHLQGLTLRTVFCDLLVVDAYYYFRLKLADSRPPSQKRNEQLLVNYFWLVVTSLATATALGVLIFRLLWAEE